MTRTEIINETANFYNLKNRGTKAGTRTACSYLTEEGLKCAFGRCMTDDALVTYGNYDRWVHELKLKVNDDLDSILKPEYHGHNVNFWSEIQMFHDDPDNWNYEGITEIGELQRKVLLEKWAEIAP